MLGKIYAEAQSLLNLLEKLNIPSLKKKAVLEVCKRRMDMLLNPLHKAAFCLDPEYWDRDLTMEDGLDEQPGAVCISHVAGSVFHRVCML